MQKLNTSSSPRQISLAQYILQNRKNVPTLKPVVKQEVSLARYILLNRKYIPTQKQPPIEKEVSLMEYIRDFNFG